MGGSAGIHIAPAGEAGASKRLNRRASGSRLDPESLKLVTRANRSIEVVDGSQDLAS
ncbi:MAG TPA: hypothetical protein VFT45_16715 [Longimicrobium sp.]|nr:hypothetical protein [Longimicrobium sp.]